MDVVLSANLRPIPRDAPADGSVFLGVPAGGDEFVNKFSDAAARRNAPTKPISRFCGGKILYTSSVLRGLPNKLCSPAKAFTKQTVSSTQESVENR